MKTLLIFTFFFISYISNSQNNNCDSILWTKDVKLKWSDFKGNVDTLSEYGAVSYNSIAYKLSRRNDTVNIYVKCFFNPCISWRKPSSNDDIGLIHEQTHFTIAEYFKRLLIKKIIERQFSRANIVKEVKDIYEAIRKERAIIDKKYDEETNYSRNKKNQYHWTEKYKKLVEGLNKYDKSEIYFILKS